jgi:hypothetical protein
VTRIAVRRDEAARVKGALSLLAMAALLGCAGSPPRTDVQATDDRVFQPIVRLSGSMGPAHAAPSQPQDGVAFELSASRARGSDSQPLASGAAPVEYNGRVFPAPQALQHDFDLALYDVSGRWRHFFQGGDLGVELLFGMAYAELNLEVSGTGGRAAGTESAFGPVLAAGLVWRLRPSTGVHARLTYYDAFESDESGQRFELALVQSLARHVSLRAGYLHTRFEFAQDTANVVDVRASGPMLGLELHF